MRIVWVFGCWEIRSLGVFRLGGCLRCVNEYVNYSEIGFLFFRVSLVIYVYDLILIYFLFIGECGLFGLMGECGYVGMLGFLGFMGF